MVQAAPDKDDLFRRLRDRYKSDEECMDCVEDIIAKKLDVWPVPTVE